MSATVEQAVKITNDIMNKRKTNVSKGVSVKEAVKITNQSIESKTGTFFNNIQNSYKKNINLDTLSSDLTSLNETLTNVYDGWQSKETMDKTKPQVENMYNRLKSFQAYSTDFGDGSVDVSEQVNAYKSILDEWDSIAKRYRKYKNADEYNKAVKSKIDYDTYNFEENKESIRLLESDLNAVTNVEKQISRIKAEQDAIEFAMKKGVGGDQKKYEENKKRLTLLNNALKDAWGKYGSKEELKATLNEKRSQYKSAEDYQTLQKFFSVSNPEADNYKKDFERYSKAGLKLPANTFGGLKTGGKVEATVAEGEMYYKAALAMSHYANGEEIPDNNIFKHMKKEEFETFAYWRKYDERNGTTNAYTFIDLMIGILEEREGNDIYENMPTWKKALYWVPGGLENWVQQTKQFFSEDKIAPTHTQVASALVKEEAYDTNRLLGNLYTAGETVSSQIPNILLTKGVSSLASGSATLASAATKIGKAAGGVGMFISSAGGAYGQALEEGKTKAQARTYSTIVGALEAGLQTAIGGISAYGGVSESALMGKIALIKNTALRLTSKYVVQLGAEVTEEELQLFFEPYVRKIVFGDEYDAPSIEEILDTAFVTAISTGVLNAPSNIADGTKVNGLSVNEAKVIDKVYKDIIAEAEQDGKKLTNKEKSKIYDEVFDKLKKGEISTNTIEEVSDVKNQKASTNAVSQPLETYNTEKQNLIKSFLNSVDGKIKNFVKRVKSGDLTFKRERISNVNERTVKDIKNLLGIDTTGYTHNINTNGIQHILNRHGENGEHDNTMSSDDDIARVGWVLENYDYVEILEKDGEISYSSEFRDSNDKPSPQIRFVKKIDGTYYVVEAACENKYNKLWVQSAYLTKNKEDVTQAAFADNDQDTNAQSALASPSSNNNIPQGENVVNTNISTNEQNNSQNENGETPSSESGRVYDDITPQNSNIEVLTVRKKNKQRRHTTAKEQAFIKRIAKALGVKVEFENITAELLRSYGYDIKDGAILPDGYYNRNTKTIHIGFSVYNPVTFVLKHELTHFGEGTVQYEKFVKAVRNSRAFKKWLKNKTGFRKSKNLEDAYLLMIAKPRGYTLNENGELSEADRQELMCEVIADFVGDCIFDSDTSMLNRMMSELDENERNVVFKHIQDFFSYLLRKLQGEKQLTFEIMRLEKEFNKMLNEAVHTKKETPTDNGGDLQFDIAVLENGSTYVKASRKVINGTTLKDQRADITSFFKKLLKNKPSIDIHTIEGDVLTITMDDTADKARDNYKLVNGKPVKMSAEEFAVKLRVESHIDEIAETALKENKPLTNDEKNHDFAKDGFEYRTAYFEDFDGQYYKIRFSIGHNGTVATVYNVGKIKEDVPSSAKVIAVVGSRALNGSSSNDIILNNEPIVNNNYMQESGKNSNNKLQFSFVRAHDATLIKEAEQMEKDLQKWNRNSGEIRSETWFRKGVMRDTKGIWVREIEDRSMKFFPFGDAKKQKDLNDDGSVYRKGKVEDFIKHPKLFKEFPILKSFYFEICDFKDDRLGEFDAKNFTIRIAAKKVLEANKKFEELGRNMPRDAYKNPYREVNGIIIHEIQHALQRLENRESGSSIEYWNMRFDRDGSLPINPMTGEQFTPESAYWYTNGEYEAREAQRRISISPKYRNGSIPDLGHGKTISAKESVAAKNLKFSIPSDDGDVGLTEAESQLLNTPDAQLTPQQRVEKQSIIERLQTSGNADIINSNQNVGDGVNVGRQNGNGNQRLGREVFSSENQTGAIQGNVGGNNDSSRTEGIQQRGSSEVRNQGNNRRVEPTPEQKESLKTTAIKDENGNPKEVSHFTDNMDFETFEKGDIGFHFGSEQQAIERGKNLKKTGRIIKAFLDIKNPFKISTDLMTWSPMHIAFKLSVDGVITQEQYNQIKEMQFESGGSYNSPAAIELRKIFSDLGYDGIVYENMFEAEGESYIAFYPEQVIIIDDGKTNNEADFTESANFMPENEETSSSESGEYGLSEPSDQEIHREPTAEEYNEAMFGEMKNAKQRHILDVAKKLDSGMKVVFVSKDAKVLSGKKGVYMRESNTMYLSKDNSAVESYFQLFKHECIHRLESRGAYQGLKNYLFRNSSSFESYARAQLKAKYKTEFKGTREEALQALAQLYIEDVQNGSFTEKFKKGFTLESAQREMVADFISEILFKGNRRNVAQHLSDGNLDAISKIEDTLSEFESLTETDRKWFEKIIDWIKDLIASLKGVNQNKRLVEDLEYIEKRLGRVYDSWDTKKAAKNSGGVMYSLNSYSEQQINNWSKSKKIIIYKSENGLLDFVEKAISEPNYKAKMYFGTVSKALADRIKADTGLDLLGRNVTLRADNIRKILKPESHGDAKREKKKKQVAVEKTDFIKIKEVIGSPDTIKPSKEKYEGKPTIVFAKIINQQKVSIIAVDSGSSLDLFVQTMYIGKNKGNITDMLNGNTSEQTFKTTAGTVPSNSVPHVEDAVNSNSMQETENYSEVDENGEGSFSLGSPAQQMRDNLKKYESGEYGRADGEIATFGGIDTDKGRHLDKAQQDEIKEYGEKLGREVIFEDFYSLDKFKGKKKIPDGYIDKDGKVHINYYAKRPVYFLLKHEVTHYLKRSLSSYVDFMNLVFESEAFKDWLSRKGHTLDSLKAEITDTYSEVENFNEERCYDEILADFVGEYLFGGEYAVSQKLINALQPKQKKTFGDIIRSIIDYFRNKFAKNKTLLTEIEQIENEFIRVYKEAVEIEPDEAVEENYSIAGQKSQTANKSELYSAINRMLKGEDAETVRKDTGWYKGKDGRWRYYIPDNELNIDGLENLGDGIENLGNCIKHKKLFKAYPQLKNVKISFGDIGIRKRGHYDSKNNEIILNRKLQGHAEKTKDTLVHEIQHAIQYIEGFAKGGNQKLGHVYALNEAYEKAKQMQEFNDLTTKEDKYRYLLSLAFEIFGANNQKQLRHNAYKSIYGEVEARQVKLTRNFDENMLKLTQPDLSGNVVDITIEAEKYIENFKEMGYTEEEIEELLGGMNNDESGSLGDIKKTNISISENGLRGRMDIGISAHGKNSITRENGKTSGKLGGRIQTTISERSDIRGLVRGIEEINTQDSEDYSIPSSTIDLIDSGKDDSDIKSGIKKVYRNSSEVKKNIKKYMEELSGNKTFTELDQEDQERLKSNITSALATEKTVKAIAEKPDRFDELYTAFRNNKSNYKRLKQQMLDEGMSESLIEDGLEMARIAYMKSVGIDVSEYLLYKIATSKKYADTDNSGGVSNAEKKAAVREMDIDQKIKNYFLNQHK